MLAADHDEEIALANVVAGLVGALGGSLLSANDPSYQHNTLTHVPHQLLLAVPLGLLATLLLRPARPRAFWVGAAGALGGLILGEFVLLTGIGLTH